MTNKSRMIHVVGPGGAGKSTVAPLLATLLGIPFHDLDAVFTATYGDVDAFIDAHDYRAYAAANVRTYFTITGADTGVVALSSGFMAYPSDVESRYAPLRAALAVSPMTVVLLPALELEVCVAETVRRQVSRGAGRTTAGRAEAKIRERFTLYAALPARKVATAYPPEVVAAEIPALVGAPRQERCLATSRAAAELGR